MNFYGAKKRTGLCGYCCGWDRKERPHLQKIYDGLVERMPANFLQPFLDWEKRDKDFSQPHYDWLASVRWWATLFKLCTADE